jgi:hypothetical protein
VISRGIRALTVSFILLSFSHSLGAIALEGSWSTAQGQPVNIGHSTYTGSNRILVFTAMIENAGSRHADTVYLGNASEAMPMTRVAIDSAANHWTEMWYATDAQISTNQSSGVDSVYVVWTGSASSFNVVMGVAVYSGIDQTALAVDSGGTTRGCCRGC